MGFVFERSLGTCLGSKEEKKRGEKDELGKKR